MPGPLAGIKVVDVSTILSGPIAAMLLADQGAEVVKVERPGIGDLTRIVPFRRGGLSSLFANANRGKRSIVLALDKPRGREILLELVRRADVFVENYRPGKAERLLAWRATVKMREAVKRMVEAERALASADSLIAPDAEATRELRRLLLELAEAAQAIRLLAEQLEQHPESLLRGKEAGQ